MSTPQQPNTPRPFLGVRFITCHTYGRLYKNNIHNAYMGMCPKCGKYYKIKIGTKGTTKRFFEAQCY